MNKGFTLLEMTLVLLLCSVMTMSYTMKPNRFVQHFDTVAILLKISETQYQAIMKHQQMCVSPELVNASTVCFNGRGNVNQARTLYFNLGKNRIVIQLGAGKHYVS